MKKFNKILLIDDDPIDNYLNEVVIQKLYLTNHIQTFFNGEEAIQYLQEEYLKNLTLPDLIILDIIMPVMDGFEFLTALSKLNIPKTNHIKIILLTTSVSSDEEAKLISMGLPLIKKPLTQEKMSDLLNNILINSSQKHPSDNVLNQCR